MNLGRGPAIQRAVRAFLVVEPEIRRQPLFECWHRAIFTQIDILVLDAAPESFNKNIIQCPAAAVHADQDLVFQQPAGEVNAGELAPLVAVEDTRMGM